MLDRCQLIVIVICPGVVYEFISTLCPLDGPILSSLSFPPAFGLLAWCYLLYCYCIIASAQRMELLGIKRSCFSSC